MGELMLDMQGTDLCNQSEGKAIGEADRIGGGVRVRGRERNGRRLEEDDDRVGGRRYGPARPRPSAGEIGSTNRLWAGGQSDQEGKGEGTEEGSVAGREGRQRDLGTDLAQEEEEDFLLIFLFKNSKKGYSCIKII